MVVSEVLSAYWKWSQANGVHCPESAALRLQTFEEFGNQFGKLPVLDCRPYMLRDWIESHPGWRSSGTKKSRANMIAAAFNFAVREGRIDRNPFQGVSYKQPEPRPAMEEDALAKILFFAPKRYERLLRFLRLTGARMGEVCGMTWPDVDMNRGFVIVRKHKTRQRTGQPRIIVLVAEAVELLKEVRRTQEPNYQGIVFLNNRGTAYNRLTIGQMMRRLKARHAILTPASTHGLRHAFATHAIASGAPLKLVSTALGHQSQSTTERFYSHVQGEIEAIRDAANLAIPREGNHAMDR
jgi:integrase